MRTSRRNVADRDEAEALLADWRAGHASFKAFVRSRGIDGRSLNCRRLNLEREATARAEPQRLRLLELTTKAPVAATYLVRIRGVEIEVGDDFRDETVVRLLRVASRC